MALLSTLNTEQEQAVTHGVGPLLIIAGAGTGKTTVVTERIKYLILEKKVPPSEILALTFTEKAAREMEERVDIALPYGYTQMWISTFHAFCDRVLREEAISIGLNPGYKLVTESEAIMFLRKNLYKFELDYYRPLGNPNKFIQGLLQHFARLKDDDITPEQYIEFADKTQMSEYDPDEIKKINELAKAYKVYEDLKAKEGIMDFSDLISNVLKLFRTRKNVLYYYQKKFQYILVDEFQDTNYAQNEMAILLAGKKQNITVVGDDDQSIYKWRGAALANMIQFREHFPNSKIITLINNYRSTSSVLDSAYKLIQFNNPERLEVKEKIDKRLKAMRAENGSPVEFLFGSRVEQEAELVVKKIQELVKMKKFNYNDFAILLRANDHSQPFTRALSLAGIPFQFLGPGHLFHQEEIKDLIAYLKVLYNFEDNAALYRVLTLPIFKFEAVDIAAILNYAKKKNLTIFESLENIDDTFLPEPTKEQAKNLVEMIKKHLKRVPKETAGQILYYFFEDSGLLKQFINPENNQAEKSAQNIAKFFEKLKSYEAEHEDSSIFAVIDWIDLAMTLGESPLAADNDWSENNAVNLLTIHSSKGLEFPVVFVVNLVSQRFPSRDRREQIPVPRDLIREELPESQDGNIAEERRLFYVAMTRARDYLFLTAANYYGEGKRERKLSPFVFETLGKEAVEKQLFQHKAQNSVEQLSLLDILNDHKEAADSQKIEALNPTPYTPHPITYLSYSQIQTFDMCPLHYKLKYILKIPPFPSPALSFGNSVHAVLKDYYIEMLKNGKPQNDYLDELIKNNWISEGYESKSHEKSAYAHAKEIIQSFLATDKNTTPLAIEVPFQFSITGIKLGGRIDRVDRLPDGKIEVIDYKTGLTLPTEKSLLTNLQLTMYALAVNTLTEEPFNKSPEDMLLSLHFLEAEKRFSTTRTKEQLEEAKQLFLQKADDISKSDFACTAANCKNCEYKILCQTYSS